MGCHQKRRPRSPPQAGRCCLSFPLSQINPHTLAKAANHTLALILPAKHGSLSLPFSVCVSERGVRRETLGFCVRERERGGKKEKKQGRAGLRLASGSVMTMGGMKI
jgi:hypothetical protein